MNKNYKEQNNVMVEMKSLINNAINKGVKFSITDKSLIIELDNNKEWRVKHEILFT